MSGGTNLRGTVNSAIFTNTNIRSTCTITPYTYTEGTSGGYGAPTRTAGTAASVNCVPASYFDWDGGTDKTGYTDEGGTVLIVPAGTDVDEFSEVSFDSRTYRVERIKKIHYNDVDIAIRLELGNQP